MQDFAEPVLGEGLALGLLGALAGSFAGFVMASAVSRSVFGSPVQFHLAALPLLLLAGMALSGLGAGLALRQALRAEALSLLRSHA